MARRSPKRGWKQWSEAEAREVLAAWRVSGVSAHAFARQRGVSPHRLSYWRQRLASEATVGFVPVLRPAAVEARIEIVRAGVVVRVRELIDPERLARIVDALGRRSTSC